jgi:hypothetical protein
VIAVPIAVITLCLLVVAASRWLTRKPAGAHHRPEGESAHRPLLALSQHHHGERVKPHGRHEILPGLMEVPA